MTRIRNGVAYGEISWFKDNLRRVVGDGVDTNIWSDPWLGGISLKERFKRLFELSECQWTSVAYMFSLGWEEGEETWK